MAKRRSNQRTLGKWLMLWAVVLGIAGLPHLIDIPQPVSVAE